MTNIEMQYMSLVPKLLNRLCSRVEELTAQTSRIAAALETKTPETPEVKES